MIDTKTANLTGSEVGESRSADLEETGRTNFIRAIIEEDLRTSKHDGRVVTRFPPEPNGYMHIGHAKSVCLNFGLARDYNGVCHLRFDDTNPASENMEYVEAFQRDVRWLGFDWADKLFFASDYYEQLYAFAVQLIEKGLAYVCSLSEEEIREYRGTLTEPGKPSPYRERSVAENLDLFERMRKGEFPDGKHVLRAKIDLASPNMKMRDPLLYRIRHEPPHYRRGKDWCIYPMYDFTHCLSDAIERITHSICTLEFDNNRELYDWIVQHVDHGCVPPPEQTEFARLSLSYCMMSKRKLLQLVRDKVVSGWDDPRMPTIAGMRRRGYTPEAIRDFSERIGISKANSVVDFGLLEFALRNDLNFRAPRIMCVLRPLKVVIENYPADQTEDIEAPSFPRDVGKEGSRIVPFSRELYIDRDDFMEDPPKDYYRLSPGAEVRLRYAYVIKCNDVIKDESGEIVELRCTCDLESKGQNPKGRKIQGIIHWVSAAHAIPTEVRLYDQLFTHEHPDSLGDKFKDFLNPNSLEILRGCLVEPSVANALAGSRYQFERHGYFCIELVDSSSDTLSFNRIVSLRESRSKSSENTAEIETTEHQAPATAAPPKQRSAKANTRPPKRSKVEVREKARMETPELAARFIRYTEELGLSSEEADLLTGDLAVADFFEQTLDTHREPQQVANWLVNELLRELKEGPISELLFSAADLGTLLGLIASGEISGKIAKNVFAEMMTNGGEPQAIVQRLGLKQITDPAELASLIDQILTANPEPVSRYQAGEQSLFGFFVGQVMKASRGQANPQLVNQILRQKL